MICKYCGKSLANNDEATDHAGKCEVMDLIWTMDCPHCQKDFGVTQDYLMLTLGKPINCPRCGGAIKIVKDLAGGKYIILKHNPSTS